MYELMGYQTAKESPAVNKERVRKIFRNNSEPIITAKDVANRFNVSNQYANRKLREFVRDGLLEQRRVGASAKVYWLSSDSDC